LSEVTGHSFGQIAGWSRRIASGRLETAAVIQRTVHPGENPPGGKQVPPWTLFAGCC